MYCNNCGKKLEDGANFCSHCGSHQKSNNDTSEITTPENYSSVIVMETSKKKRSHGFLKFIAILTILVGCILGISKIIDSKKNPYNQDGATQLFKRSANNNDIYVNSDLDLSNLGVKYIITPQVDIDGLKVTIEFLDKNMNALDSYVKSIGNVKKGVQVNFSISLLDLGISVAWNTKYESLGVTGGTVSYFA
ncbi:MAG: zinc ribbon domain-containing protein [Erysipelotrichales bacterium]|nr:zinc ribbon domain-containing protein [Erysipelotrichales bacterium]